MNRRILSIALLAPLMAAAAPPSTNGPMVAPAPPILPEEVAKPPLIVPPHIIPTLTDKQLDQLRRFLGEADADGIAPDGLGSATPVTNDPTAIVNAVLDQARALHRGRLGPSDFMNAWGLRPSAYDPWAGFVAAVQQDRIASWAASLRPPYAGYDTLKKALAVYRSIEGKGGWNVLSSTDGLVPGGAGERVNLLRARLAVEDKDVSRTSSRYDDGLVAAVQRAQRRYGLEPTGVVGSATLAALNVSARNRVRQIEANLERWRWLPSELPTQRVQVNIAAAVLTMFDADKPVLSMRAVTGRPGDETPMLSSAIHSIVFNPPWNVPNSIATKELWPKEHAHPGYLAAHAFKVIDTGTGTRLQQKAGPKSALGRIKFDFDNPYGVYLHDTPTQATFSRYSRLASHGCVRLARPRDLAALLLSDKPDWTAENIDATIAKGDTIRSRLTQPVAVFLLYWTAYASADGRVTFLDDPYGWDAELANRLNTSANRAKRMVMK